MDEGESERAGMRCVGRKSMSKITVKIRVKPICKQQKGGRSTASHLSGRGGEAVRVRCELLPTGSSDRGWGDSGSTGT